MTARGLLCLTGLSGERAPLWNPTHGGCSSGSISAPRRGHIARAILEGAALRFSDVVEILQSRGAGIGRLRVVGGGALSPLWNQIRAEATGLPGDRARRA